MKTIAWMEATTPDHIAAFKDGWTAWKGAGVDTLGLAVSASMARHLKDIDVAADAAGVNFLPGLKTSTIRGTRPDQLSFWALVRLVADAWSGMYAARGVIIEQESLYTPYLREGGPALDVGAARDAMASAFEGYEGPPIMFWHPLVMAPWVKVPNRLWTVQHLWDASTYIPRSQFMTGVCGWSNWKDQWENTRERALHQAVVPNGTVHVLYVGSGGTERVKIRPEQVADHVASLGLPDDATVAIYPGAAKWVEVATQMAGVSS